MVLELYLDLVSQPCRAVYIFAKKNKIPFEFKSTELMKGQNRGEDFLKVNPDGKVPAMKDGDFALAESIAILLYLARKHRTPDHWYPSDLQKRARVDEFLSWQHTGARQAGSKVFLIKALVPLFLGRPLPEEKLAAAMEVLERRWRSLREVSWEGGGPSSPAARPSLADLVALVELMHVCVCVGGGGGVCVCVCVPPLQPVAAGHDLFASRPKMAAWRSRVEGAVGRELFQEAHKPLFDSKDASLDHLPPALREQLTGLLLKYIG
nr:PREDICTED: glutathione S-transferase theta-1 [Anolis carolinensis]|eukprot:XP_008122745.2 PREDICTED: glutathione S-transferase theta-1 [Anolis carolinensis]